MVITERFASSKIQYFPTIFGFEVVINEEAKPMILASDFASAQRAAYDRIRREAR